MRVSSKTGTSAVGATRKTSATSGISTTPATSGVAPVGDALSVSGTAQFLAVARAYIAKVPDIRQAKVEALRSKLASDSYHPDGEEVADGLVREHMPPPRNP
jgi:negative regulator of flagellin synthesis FlgM